MHGHQAMHWTPNWQPLSEGINHGRRGHILVEQNQRHVFLLNGSGDAYAAAIAKPVAIRWHLWNLKVRRD